MMDGSIIRCVLKALTVFAVLQNILIAGTYGNHFGVSDKCRKALVACVVPLALPYAKANNVSQVLEIARNIRLGEHCRKTRKSLTCLQDAGGGNQCSDLDPKIVKLWKQAYEPILEDVWKNICRTELKKFSIHYSCLLTEEVYYGLQRNCSSVSNGSQAADCLGRVIKEECGSTASKITKALFESVFKRIESIRGQGFDRDEDDDEEGGGQEARDPDEGEEDYKKKKRSMLPGNVHARALDLLQKLLVVEY